MLLKKKKKGKKRWFIGLWNEYMTEEYKCVVSCFNTTYFLTNEKLNLVQQFLKSFQNYLWLTLMAAYVWLLKPSFN